MSKRYYLYILTNKNRTTLYVGVTGNLQQRLSQHEFDSLHGKYSFAGKYNCINLIYYEIFESMPMAILREKELKRWRREKRKI